jgi:hypothetical protein
MGLRTMGTTVRLTDYKDELVGLRFVDTQTITSTPAWADGAEVTQEVPRADVVLIKTLKGGEVKAELVGRSLIFQRAIAEDIRGNRDWAVGVLRENDRPTPAAPDATMYELEEPNIGLEAIGDAFEAAHISL